MSNIKKQIPDWHVERHLDNIQKDLDIKGEVVFNWFISKNALIATLNAWRGKGYKCEWIEKSEGNYDVKISKPHP
jgi:hypothetical protein